ncbi:MAG: UbiX family flavin prenyltransferase [Thermoguttaceae bacterium]|nr:UbiX family flavin prenyltransferase [Thermoguttaceae bacterium]MDW8078251.1 flavin prenyltransferase UbiX [Thermoguttaceae bacterium]
MSCPENRRFVLAITGASGVIYGIRLLRVLVQAGHEIDLLISPAGRDVLEQELGIALDLEAFELGLLEPFFVDGMPTGNSLQNIQQSREESATLTEAASPRLTERVFYWHYRDWSSPLASGSSAREAMVICPCSLATLASIVHGISDNLIRRAAEVHLKERRSVIVVPRETPLSTIQLRNLYRASRLGIVVLPAMPGFYHRPKSVEELVDFVVARVCDQLRIKHNLAKRWPAV